MANTYNTRRRKVTGAPFGVFLRTGEYRYIRYTRTFEIIFRSHACTTICYEQNTPDGGSKREGEEGGEGKGKAESGNGKVKSMVPVPTVRTY